MDDIGDTSDSSYQTRQQIQALLSRYRKQTSTDETQLNDSKADPITLSTIITNDSGLLPLKEKEQVPTFSIPCNMNFNPQKNALPKLNIIVRDDSLVLKHYGKYGLELYKLAKENKFNLPTDFAIRKGNWFLTFFKYCFNVMNSVIYDSSTTMTTKKDHKLLTSKDSINNYPICASINTNITLLKAIASSLPSVNSIHKKVQAGDYSTKDCLGLKLTLDFWTLYYRSNINTVNIGDVARDMYSAFSEHQIAFICFSLQKEQSIQEWYPFKPFSSKKDYFSYFSKLQEQDTLRNEGLLDKYFIL